MSATGWLIGGSVAALAILFITDESKRAIQTHGVAKLTGRGATKATVARVLVTKYGFTPAKAAKKAGDYQFMWPHHASTNVAAAYVAKQTAKDSSKAWRVLLYNYPKGHRDRRIKGTGGPYASKAEAQREADKEAGTWYPRVAYGSLDQLDPRR